MNLDTNKPYTFKEWTNLQAVDVSGNSYESYKNYLKSWYNNRTVFYSQTTKILKENYIKLLKDLLYLFSEEEKNKFLNDIDFDSEEDVIYNIPYFVTKIKEISRVLLSKRENIKNTKIKYNSIGSSIGLENILYEYILKNFTKKENNLTQIPTLAIQKFLPDLYEVKDDFYIEIEELHDPNSYYDSDPSVDITNYHDIESLIEETPFEDFDINELVNLLSTRFFEKVSSDVLSKTFKEYTEIDLLSSTNKANYSAELTRKYLGETVYSLTATRLKEVNTPDFSFSLNVANGNNWFYWPSGNKSFRLDDFSNFYEPILLNNSSFLSSGATGGTDYKNSDLLFAEKNSGIDGAWFQGNKINEINEIMSIKILAGEKREFIYPYCGFELSEIGNNFDRHSLTDEQLKDFYFLDKEKQNNILEDYYSSTLPDISIESIYINNTSLVKSGAYAETLSDSSDILIKQPSYLNINDLHSDSTDGLTEAAFLYKMQKTDLPILKELTYIYWPYITYEPNDNFPVTILQDTCIPITLKEMSVNNFVGSVAGLTIDSSDIIYKLNTRTGEPIEAAFLKSSSTDNLDQYYNSIKIYNDAANKCSKYISGPIQSSLSFKADAGKKISFIWGDVDTYADDVFKFYEHSDSCAFKENSSDLYPDQDFINNIPINNRKNWTKCSCKSVIYSPIGHAGDSVFDYNNMTDMLFHDVDGLGEYFTFNNWKDTRGLDVETSPQFSYYKLTDNTKSVGWGKGYWKTGSGDRMVLKTGRRYTYWRTSLRSDLDGATSPYFIIKYNYKDIKGYHSESFCSTDRKADLVILLDISRSQTNAFEQNKKIINSFCSQILNDTALDYKISVIAFSKDSYVISYLTKNSGEIEISLNRIEQPKSYPNFVTNLYDALSFTNYILNENEIYDPNIKGQSVNFKNLCKDVSKEIVMGSTSAIYSINDPRPDAKKKLIIFSDGAVTTLKDVDGKIYNADTVKEYIKNNLKNVDICSIDVGEYSTSNALMEQIVYPKKQNYFNLQKYLVNGEGDVKSFVEYLIQRTINDTCGPITPRWKKMIKNNLGQWVESLDESDMVIRPGDYLAYVHRPSTIYSGYNSEFILPSIGFTINAKLNGWDYASGTFSPIAIGPSFGAKPFWAKIYTDIDESNLFNKETSMFAGHLRFKNDYVPLTQPEISTLTLDKGNFLSYKRRKEIYLNWIQPIYYEQIEKINKWKKLEFKKIPSNLNEILKNNSIEKYAVATDIDSDILLESYSSFYPTKYNYYARNSFVYNENLRYIERDLNSFVVYNTGIYIEPENPYSNLLNINFPTVAVSQFPKNLVSEKEKGLYLLPEKLGASFYLGKGYFSEISNAKIDMIDSLSSERIYFDLNKYSGRYRGLSKKDQYTISDIKEINNHWISDYEYNSDKSGMIKNPYAYQKLVPYHTDYENKRKQYYGISRQDDDLELWFPLEPVNWKDKNIKLNIKNELSLENFLLKVNSLMCNIGVLSDWKTDIYGNEFGVFKSHNPNILTEKYSILFTQFYNSLEIDQLEENI
jgi:hypothetical protein